MKQGIEKFFAYARLRHEAYLAKQRGVPKGQQSTDPILNEFKFTNVFRELDRTTKWFADNVRTPLRDKPEVLLATVLFRLLNRTEVGEAIFLHDSLLAESSAFYELVRACRIDSVRKSREKAVRTAIKNIERAIVAFVGDRGPYVTGGYIITSPQGMKKLPGVLSIVEKFCLEAREWKGLGAGVYDTMRWTNGDDEGAAGLLMNNPGEFTLEATWNWLKQFDYFGPFHSYEIVTDLRHTSFLDHAPDIMTWANPGPGCLRGLNWVHERAVRGGSVLKTDTSVSRTQMLEEMRELLAYSQDSKLWPQANTSSCGDGNFESRQRRQIERDWPAWEMRDVEHTLCEFDKYERTRLGHGRPRGVYR